LHVSANSERNILDKILENTPFTGIHDKFPKEIEEKLLKEEPQIVEPEPIQSLVQTSAISSPKPLKEEETLTSNFMFDFENDLFAEYENTSKYHTTRKPQELSNHEQFLDSSKEVFIKETVKELTYIISHKWLEESKLSSEVIRLDSPSTYIHCKIHETSFNALYNLVVGVILMSASFAHALFKNISLNPITKFLKNLSGHILPSLGLVYVLPIKVNGTIMDLSFYIFDIMEFDLSKGQPIERLIHEGQKGNLN
jgi:hypothetical protein